MAVVLDMELTFVFLARLGLVPSEASFVIGAQGCVGFFFSARGEVVGNVSVHAEGRPGAVVTVVLLAGAKFLERFLTLGCAVLPGDVSGVAPCCWCRGYAVVPSRCRERGSPTERVCCEGR